MALAYPSRTSTPSEVRLRRAHERIDAEQLPVLREYDLIRGLTGIGAYLLHRHHGGELLHSVLFYLVRLTEPRRIDGDTMPGWWTANAPNDQPSPQLPGGHGNLGMAHGIAGPLALLCTALWHGITVVGQVDAIGRICAWLDQWRTGTGRRAWWPETVSATDQRAGTVRQTGPGRPSWCYGTPGRARAQQLAGLALADERRQHHAEQALAGCITDEGQLAQLQRDRGLVDEVDRGEAVRVERDLQRVDTGYAADVVVVVAIEDGVAEVVHRRRRRCLPETPAPPRRSGSPATAGSGRPPGCSRRRSDPRARRPRRPHPARSPRLPVRCCSGGPPPASPRPAGMRRQCRDSERAGHAEQHRIRLVRAGEVVQVPRPVVDRRAESSLAGAGALSAAPPVAVVGRILPRSSESPVSGGGLVRAGGVLRVVVGSGPTRRRVGGGIGRAGRSAGRTWSRRRRG